MPFILKCSQLSEPFKANILVSDSGDALITDFGCARIVDASLSLANPSSGPKGTMRYMAYELFAIGDGSTSYTDKSDVWAFGMVLFVRQL